jgi:glycerophosphoryl diester phosphodiesterase
LGHLVGQADAGDPAGAAREQAALARGCGAATVGAAAWLLAPAFIEELHRQRLAVWAWTVDEPEAMRLLIGLGVDGIITNRPDLLNAVLAGR